MYVPRHSSPPYKLVLTCAQAPAGVAQAPGGSQALGTRVSSGLQPQNRGKSGLPDSTLRARLALRTATPLSESHQVCLSEAEACQ